MKVALLAATPYSKYSLAVAELLRLRGVRVRLLVVPNMYNIQRIKITWRREGLELFQKIWTKILVSHRAVVETPLDQLMKSEGISLRPLPQYCAEHGIQYQRLPDLYGQHAAATMLEHDIDLIVFTGGGLIRRELLESTPIGILNCHWGLLPDYRGMDTTIWAEWERRSIGLTLHLMDSGVDTGPIISTHPVARAPDESFEALHKRMEAMSAERMVDTVQLICQGGINPAPQELAQGKQYFIMHDRLKDILTDRLENPRPPQNAT